MVDAPTTAFVCPRCHGEASERFYGPCAACRDQLRLEMANAPRQADVGQYEPKMNVVPNQVATKD
ncbi:MAG: small subunit ribosomal protein S27e [Acidimicrobiaceae bacterium]|jgi:predicted ATP-dependent serine protease|nr:small subunit ribosomal protein S27e [Acidimicrobiaceae bacterium]